jgi:hypothetical protein
VCTHLHSCVCTCVCVCVCAEHLLLRTTLTFVSSCHQMGRVTMILSTAISIYRTFKCMARIVDSSIRMGLHGEDKESPPFAVTLFRSEVWCNGLIEWNSWQHWLIVGADHFHLQATPAYGPLPFNLLSAASWWGMCAVILHGRSLTVWVKRGKHVRFG